jgi:hypothetical protein
VTRIVRVIAGVVTRIFRDIDRDVTRIVRIIDGAVKYSASSEGSPFDVSVAGL